MPPGLTPSSPSKAGWNVLKATCFETGGAGGAGNLTENEEKLKGLKTRTFASSELWSWEGVLSQRRVFVPLSLRAWGCHAPA